MDLDFEEKFQEVKEFHDEDVIKPVMESLHLNVKDFNSSIHRNSYNLLQRVSEEELITKYNDDVKQSTSEFVNSILRHKKMLLYNVQMCRKMDRRFGVVASEEKKAKGISPLRKLKDGSINHRCPWFKCETATFKLKRHLKEQHDVQSEETMRFALNVAHLITKNRQEENHDKALVESSLKTETKSNSRTQLVNRKSNFKECILCLKLILNLSDHVTKTHKIAKDDPMYDYYVRTPEVVPRCYTKMEKGCRIKLEGEELDTAKNFYESSVIEQKEDLVDLIELRKEIEKLQEKIYEEEDIDEYRKIKKSLEIAQEKYKKIRYKDCRNYTEHVKLWAASFEEHLTSISSNNPIRSVRMAVDVLLPYETVQSHHLQFKHISDPKIIRNILDLYRSHPGTSNSSKIKYVRVFEQFITFIFNDINSPEYINNDESQKEVLLRGIAEKKIVHEIRSQISILTKKLGFDNIERKKKAKTKLFEHEEMSTIFKEHKDLLMTVLEDSKTNAHLSYDKKRIIKIRNSLIIIGTIRLGRRAKEFTTMNIDSVENAKVEMVDGETFYFVEVIDQKTAASSGDPAIVPYQIHEFEVLKIFIKDLRVKISEDKFCNVVFPTSRRINTNASCDLTLAGVAKALAGIPTTSGKKLSSRVIRTSTVTNSRTKPNIGESEKRTMARAMNHRYDTAEKHYNFMDLSNSVAQTLSFNSLESHELEKSEEIGSGLELSKEGIAASSTPVKKRKLTLRSSDDSGESLDVTLKTLRTKKIRIMKNKTEDKNKCIATKRKE